MNSIYKPLNCEEIEKHRTNRRLTVRLSFEQKINCIREVIENKLMRSKTL